MAQLLLPREREVKPRRTFNNRSGRCLRFLVRSQLGEEASDVAGAEPWSPHWVRDHSALCRVGLAQLVDDSDGQKWPFSPLSPPLERCMDWKELLGPKGFIGNLNKWEGFCFFCFFSEALCFCGAEPKALCIYLCIYQRHIGNPVCQLYF